MGVASCWGAEQHHLHGAARLVPAVVLGSWGHQVAPGHAEGGGYRHPHHLLGVQGSPRSGRVQRLRHRRPQLLLLQPGKLLPLPDVYEIWVEAEGWVSERLVVNTGDIGESIAALGGKRGSRRAKPVAPNGVGWVRGVSLPDTTPCPPSITGGLGGSCRAAPCCPHLTPTLWFCSPKRSSQDGPPPGRDGQRRGHLPVGGLAVPAGHRSLLLPTAVPAAVPGVGQQRVGGESSVLPCAYPLSAQHPPTHPCQGPGELRPARWQKRLAVFQP